MRCRCVLIVIVFLFSNFVCAEAAQDNTFMESIKCDAQDFLFKYDGSSFLTIQSTNTNLQTEILCVGQCGIDEWACVSVDDISYLWFRGVNAVRYTIGTDEGHEYIGHWMLQLNEINWKVQLEHTL